MMILGGNELMLEVRTLGGIHSSGPGTCHSCSTGTQLVPLCFSWDLDVACGLTAGGNGTIQHKILVLEKISRWFHRWLKSVLAFDPS